MDKAHNVEITHKSVFALFCLSGVAFFPNIWCSAAYVDPLNVGCSEIWVISRHNMGLALTARIVLPKPTRGKRAPAWAA